MRILILFLVFLVACNAQLQVARNYNDETCTGDVVFTIISSNCNASSFDVPCTTSYAQYYGTGTSLDGHCESDLPTPQSGELVLQQLDEQCLPDTGGIFYFTPSACLMFTGPPNPFVRVRCRGGEVNLFQYPDNTCAGVGLPATITTCPDSFTCPQFECQSGNVPLRMSMFALAAYTPQTFNRAVSMDGSIIDGSVVLSVQQSSASQDWVLVEDLCLDAIVIVLRGTDNDLDWVTNIRAGTTSWAGGYIHSGYYLRAIRIFNEIYQVYGMQDLPNRFSTLYITGHSSGAAVAAILSYMFDGFVPTVQGYGFGTPRLATSDIPFTNFISYVYENDIVPRLSIWSGLDAIQQCQDEITTEIIDTLNLGLSTGQSCRSLIDLYASVSDNNILFEIPGTVYLSQNGDLIQSSSADLSNIVQSSDAFYHHSMELYVNSLGGSAFIVEFTVSMASCPSVPECVALVLDLSSRKRAIDVDFVAGDSYYCALTGSTVNCITIAGDAIDTTEISALQPRQIAVCRGDFMFVADTTVYGTDLQGTIQPLYELEDSTSIIVCDDVNIYSLTGRNLTGLTVVYTRDVPVDYTHFELLAESAVFTVGNTLYIYDIATDISVTHEFTNIMDMSARSNVIAVLEPTTITVINLNVQPAQQYTMELSDSVLTVYVDASGKFVHALWANGHIGMYEIANATIVPPGSDSGSPLPDQNSPSQQTPSSNNNTPSNGPSPSAPSGSNVPSGSNTPSSGNTPSGTRPPTPLNMPNQASGPSNGPFNVPADANGPIHTPVKDANKPVSTPTSVDAGKVSATGVVVAPAVLIALSIVVLVV